MARCVENGQDLHPTAYSEIVSFISRKRLDPSSYGHLLVSGITGVGKTTLLKTILAGLDSPHQYYSCSALFEAGTGRTEQKLSRLLTLETSSGFGVVILDDLDVVARRPHRRAGNDMEYRVLSVLTRLLDTAHNVVVIGVTCQPDIIDAQLRRSGRFMDHVQVSISTLGQRRAFLDSTLASELLSKEQVEQVASKTHGFTLADLEHVKTEAFRLAFHRSNDSPDLHFSDFIEAIRNTRPTIMVDLPLLASSSTANRQVQLVGLEGIKQEIMDLIHFPLIHGSRIEQMRLCPPRGVMLYGPSGSGKTTLALECARDSGLPVIHIQAASVRSKYVGQSEKNLAGLFKRARECAPSLLFLDQMDQLFSSRGQGGSNNSQDRLIACLLTELDGIGSQRADGVFLVAATNRLQAVDPAVLRPGRIGVHIRMPEFDASLRRAFIKDRAARMPLQMSAEQVQVLISKTNDYTGAMMEGLFREAALKTLRDDFDAVSMTFDSLLTCIINP